MLHKQLKPSLLMGRDLRVAAPDESFLWHLAVTFLSIYPSIPNTRFFLHSRLVGVMVNTANLVFLASNVSQLTHSCVYFPCCPHNALQGGLDSGCFLAAASSATSGELQTDATPPPPSLLILSLILSVSVTTLPIVRVQVMANRRLCCTCSHKHHHLGFCCCV